MGDFEEMSGLCIPGVLLQQIEEVRDGVERVVNLVGYRGGETPGDGELFVGEQRGAGSPLHCDIAEDHDDAREFAGFVADGGSAVVDGDFRSVLANEQGVIGDADDAIEALDLGDWIFDRLAGTLVDDGEDLVEWLVAGL